MSKVYSQLLKLFAVVCTVCVPCDMCYFLRSLGSSKGISICTSLNLEQTPLDFCKSTEPMWLHELSNTGWDIPPKWDIIASSGYNSQNGI